MDDKLTVEASAGHIPEGPYKIQITERHLLPEILKSCGFESDDIYIDEEDLKFLIEYYTYEAAQLSDS